MGETEGNTEIGAHRIDVTQMADQTTPAVDDIEITKGAFLQIKQWVHDLTPGKTEYFYNIVIRLLHATLTQRHYLTIGFHKSPSLLAWACRNLLELDIITQYCLLSPATDEDSRTTCGLTAWTCSNRFRDS